MAYQHKALHERGSNAREQTKKTLAGRQRVNEQTKKFMKNEYVKHHSFTELYTCTLEWMILFAGFTDLL